MRRRAVVAVALVLALVTVREATANGNYEQVFQLQPGWNSVFLEVRPENADVEAAFAGLPIESVWMWNPPETQIEFVQDPAEGLMNLPGWLHFVPRPRPEALLNNLFRLLVHRALLIKLGGTTPVTWRVRGRPSLVPPIAWQTDSFNLLGLKVDPQSPPTFGSYFAPSRAHAGQPIYRLDPSGVWVPVEAPATTTVHSGESYWIFCSGASTYQGPLEIAVDFGPGLVFGSQLESDQLVIRNLSGIEANLRLRRLDTVNAVPLDYRRTDLDTGEASWIDLPRPLTLLAPNGTDVLVELGVRRTDLPLPTTESVLEVTNGLGSRILVPVSATSIDPAAQLGAATAGGGLERKQGTTVFPLAGLWVGEVSVSGVSESQTAGTVPMPVDREFTFRILLHVNGLGEASLLKEVIQLWQEGTEVPDPQDPQFLVTDRPGRFVLITDDSLISSFDGAGFRDGVPVGFRLSTAAYDFEGDRVETSGDFGLGGSLTWTLVLPAQAPANPYRHKFHPDHDNLDAQFLNFRQEAFTITRDMELSFATVDPTEENPPGWGNTVLGGTFRETISGLHRNRIYVEGTFRIVRVAATPVLNQ